MARTQIDLNRFRKVYPRMNQSPTYFGTEVQAFKISFSSSLSETLVIGAFTNHPVVLLGAEDNVNLWISSLVKIDTDWHVTVSTSSAYTGDVHLHAHEAT